jgi:hypothetical protein
VSWDRVLAAALPLAALAGLLLLGRSARRLWPLALGALAWGMLAVSLIIPVNDRWATAFGVTSLIVLGAPIFEEIAKSLLLPVLSVSRRVTWFVDGAVLGAAAGTGFAIRENWLYLDRAAAGEGLSLVLARVTSTNLMHAGCAALVGAAIVLASSRRGVTRFTIPLVALLIAITLHSVFNRLTRMDNESALLITATGVSVFGLAVGVVYLGFPASARWVRRDLAAAGATASEQAALSGSSVASVLDNFEARFGTPAARQAEQLVQAQRELAILQNAGRGSAAEVLELRETTDSLRRDIGMFAMMWLRSHLPADAAQPALWTTLDNSMDPTKDGDREAPGGLWSRLDGDEPVSQPENLGSTTQSDTTAER